MRYIVAVACIPKGLLALANPSRLGQIGIARQRDAACLAKIADRLLVPRDLTQCGMRRLTAAFTKLELARRAPHRPGRFYRWEHCDLLGGFQQLLHLCGCSFKFYLLNSGHFPC